MSRGRSPSRGQLPMPAPSALNGQDVSGQSPLTVLVNQAQGFILLVNHSNGATASQTIRVVVGEGGSFSIAAVADPQYADVPVGWRGGGREPEEGVNRLTHAVTQYNQRNLDWGVVLGDMIDFDDIDYGNPPPGTASGTHDWSNADAILAAWNQLNIPRYHVLGNHEFYVPNADTDGMKSRIASLGNLDSISSLTLASGIRDFASSRSWRIGVISTSIPACLNTPWLKTTMMILRGFKNNGGMEPFRSSSVGG